MSKYFCDEKGIWLDIDDVDDGWSVVRAIDKYNARERNRIKEIVREVIMESRTEELQAAEWEKELQAKADSAQNCDECNQCDECKPYLLLTSNFPFLKTSRKYISAINWKCPKERAKA